MKKSINRLFNLKGVIKMKKIQVDSKDLYPFLAQKIEKDGCVPIFMEERVAAILERKGLKSIKIGNIASKVLNADSDQEIKYRIFLVRNDDKLITMLKEFNVKDKIANEKFPLRKERLIKLFQCFSSDSSGNKGGIYFQTEYFDGLLWTGDNICNALQGRSITVEHPLQIIMEMVESIMNGHRNQKDHLFTIEYLKRIVVGTVFEKDFATQESIKITEALVKEEVGLEQYKAEMLVLIDKTRTLKYYGFGSKLSKHERVIMDSAQYCEFCKRSGKGDVLARYDGKTRLGNDVWSFMCDDHFEEYGIGLGIGLGQLISYVFEK